MALSWNEIKDRAIKFSKEWKDDFSEDAEAKSFLDDFFDVFGIHRRRVATFETRVKTIAGSGYIDMLWKGQILIEMKSRGKSLDRAYKQATDYFAGLLDRDLPKYILVCDFERFRLYDLEENTTEDFELKELYKYVRLFGFIAGYQKKIYKAEDEVNIDAALLMGKLHDELKAVGYSGHQLEIYLVRLLFCLFADDTSIFEKNIFQDFIENKTKEDGSDIGNNLAHLFQILNQPNERRMKSLDEDLNAFPYVNGKLFEEKLDVASWNSSMRNTLLECCALNWGAISPAIFGSMFQSVMDEKARRNLGAHYTSEQNILKVINPLFLDELKEEFKKIKTDKRKLSDFHKKIGQLRFLDPACGCGNFLIVCYKELRLLELEVIKEIQKGQQVLNIEQLIRLDVDQFYGIEYEDFSAQIAQVALWLTDHQMNMLVSEEFGEYFRRLPLKKSATIIHGNALRIEWQSLLNPVNTKTIYADHANIVLPRLSEPEERYGKVQVHANKVTFSKEGEVKNNEPNKFFNYILGNPPFVGKKEQNALQKEDMELIYPKLKGAGVLDYVTCWYILAAQYMQQYSTEQSRVKCGFVSTNSISQGEQVGVLWAELINKYHVTLHFAHRTFTWKSEAPGKAAVHVIIAGFSNYDIPQKRLYEYSDVKSEPHEIIVYNINPYLVGAKNVFLQKRNTPICNVTEINYGSIAIDNGHLILTKQEKGELLKSTPKAKKYIRNYTGGDEFLNNIERYCLWLVDIKPEDLREMPDVMERVKKVKQFRSESGRANTQKLALTPTLFGEIRQPEEDYILIPKVSSESRYYIPLAIVDKTTIANGSCLCVPNATAYELGVLMSTMHMSWMRSVAGRLESRYQYSNSIVYNNFPWPQNVTEKQTKAVTNAVQKVLDTRAKYNESSLADLYNTLAMPPHLVKAHAELDKAVDLCYRPQAFVTETKRIEYLFELYAEYTKDLFSTLKKVKKTKN